MVVDCDTPVMATTLMYSTTFNTQTCAHTGRFGKYIHVCTYVRTAPSVPTAKHGEV